jgi:hydrogenase expression/formation protein HypE
MSHGSGGTMMKHLIEEIFYDAYASDELLQSNDAAVLDLPLPPALSSLAPSAEEPCPQSEHLHPSAAGAPAFPRLAFSTDTFVVTPHFFPGGDIGRLAVCGTVNDVATAGATPLYLSVGLVLEEGYPLASLRRICTSMANVAQEAGVRIVTGDTKVVERGHGDGVYINTSGIGIVAAGVSLGGANCRPGDRILVSGTLGDHGIAIVSTREGLSFSTTIESDAAPLNHLVAAVIAAAPHTRCFRDPTRGGLASTLNELAAQSNTVMTVDEDAVPVSDQVRGACDMLGYDVFQVANEGKMVAIVPASEAPAALAAMRASRYGSKAALIGEVTALPATGNATPQAFVRTPYGSTRIMDMLVGEQLPRIC